MKCVTSEEMRERDRRAIAAGTPGWTLMRRAGAAVARTAARLAPLAGIRDILVLAGRGNNGGDGCVAARLLAEAGFRVRLWLAASPEQLAGDALAAWEFLGSAAPGAIPARLLPDAAAWDALDPAIDLPCTPLLAIDALLGTGAHGPLRGCAAAAVRFLARIPAPPRILAVDIPTGLDADTGEPGPGFVRADWTVTLAAPKTGMANPAALPALGHLEVADIGLPPDPVPAGGAWPEILVPSEHGAPGAPRPAAAHKGDFGHVLVAGGSPGFGGAPALAALGALRAGAGLVTAAVPAGAELQLAAWAPEAMAHPLPAPRGWLTPDTFRAWGRKPEDFDAVVAGPGLRNTPETAALVREWLANPGIPRLLLDADALNVLGDILAEEGRHPFPERAGRLVLTPHPGEAARLLGTTARVIQAHRLEAAEALAKRSGAVVVLKGAGTLVCAPGAAPLLNLSGNPGMATGGSGDLLAGIVAALWAAGADARDATALGVHLHGTAADEAAWERGQRALLPRDIAARLR